MPQAVQDAVKEWAAPFLLAALFSLCGLLWLDKNQRDDRLFEDLTNRVSALSDAVVRLTTLQEQGK